jgi:hypothetical protein
MNNIKDFKNFILESNDSNDGYRDSEDPKVREIRRRIESDQIGNELYNTIYDEGGALKRMLGATGKTLAGIAGGIGDLVRDVFKNNKIAKSDSAELASKKKEVLSKWGEEIKSSGKNKQKDYEEFHHDAIVRGKKRFGGNFDINNPRNDDERVYSEYVLDASKYYDFK